MANTKLGSNIFLFLSKNNFLYGALIELNLFAKISIFFFHDQLAKNYKLNYQILNNHKVKKKLPHF